MKEIAIEPQARLPVVGRSVELVLSERKRIQKYISRLRDFYLNQLSINIHSKMIFTIYLLYIYYI